MNAALLSRLLPFAGFTGLAVIAWLLLARSATVMADMQAGGSLGVWMQAMMRPHGALAYLAASFTMWSLMMVAMMVPAALPLLAVYRRVRPPENTATAPGLLIAGYLGVWLGFSLLAAAVQLLLHRHGLIGGMTLALAPRAAGALLLAAGAYQLTPLKEACLTHCRSPLGFLLAHWRSGRLGALRMGAAHGLFCLGCCWLLMLLMFAGGAMSVATMAALTLLICAERLLPAGPWVSRLPGALLIAAGLALLLA